MKETGSKHISVVIPTHKRAGLLKSLLESFLTQSLSFSSFEIIVVSNFDDRDSKALIESLQQTVLPIRYLVAQKIGANIARNLGAKHTTSDIVLFIDDDCYIEDQDLLQKIIQYHATHQDVMVAGGRYMLPPGSSTLEKAYFEISNSWINQGYIDENFAFHLVGGIVSYKRKIFDQNLFFDEGIIFGGAETEFHDRLQAAGFKTTLINNVCICHKPPLSIKSFIRKAYLQGKKQSINQGHSFIQISQRNILTSHKSCLVSFYIRLFFFVHNLNSFWSREFFLFKPYRRLSSCIRLFFCEMFHGIWFYGRDKTESKNNSFPSDATPQTEKAYFFPFYVRCPRSCSYCSHLNALRERNIEVSEFQTHIRQLKKIGFKKVILPCNALYHPRIESFIATAIKEEINLVVQINADVLNESTTHLFCSLIKKYHFSINLLLGSNFGVVENFLKAIPPLKTAIQTTVIATRASHFGKLIKTITRENLTQQLSFFFPQKQENEDDLLTCDEVFYVKKHIHSLQVLPPPLVSSPREDVRLCSKLLLETNSSLPITASVIIPYYRDFERLTSLFSSIESQSMNADAYEIIVVDDDGGPFESRKVSDFLQSKKNALNLKYIYFSGRHLSSQKSLFRAGMARNVGAYFAKSNYLIFVDSDIRLPSNAFTEIVEALKSYDLVQTKRTGPKDKYWQSFYNNHGNWNGMEHKWLYVSTSCLAVKKDLFVKNAGFNSAFLSYGYEDTEFGYRLAKIGASFLLLHDVVVQHVSRHRSIPIWHTKNKLSKHQKMAISAKTFYLNHLTNEVFKVLFVSLGNHLIMRFLIKHFATKKLGHLLLHSFARLFFRHNAERLEIWVDGLYPLRKIYYIAKSIR